MDWMIRRPRQDVTRQDGSGTEPVAEKVEASYTMAYNPRDRKPAFREFAHQQLTLQLDELTADMDEVKIATDQVSALIRINIRLSISTVPRKRIVARTNNRVFVGF